MGIGDLRFLSGKNHRVLKVGDILKNSVQQVFSGFNPAFPHQSGIRTFFKIKCLRLKCHGFLLPALLSRGNSLAYQMKISCPVSFQMASIK